MTSPDSPPDQLYYYTSTKGADAIKQAGVIRGTVTLSTLKPEDYQKIDILKSISKDGQVPHSVQNRADWVVIVDGSKLDKSKLEQQNQSSYNYSGDITIRKEDVIEKPKYQRGSGGTGEGGGGGGGGGSVEVTSWDKSDAKNYYYHYTDTYGGRAIKACKYLRKSVESAAFGAGVYLTDVEPHEFWRSRVLKSDGGFIKAFKGRAEWVVRVAKNRGPLDRSKLHKVGDAGIVDNRSIYVYPDVIRVQPNQVASKTV